MTNEPFFKRDGDHYVPNPVSRGPWNPQSLHGRVIAGLLGHEIERKHGEPDFIPARLTVDMFRLPGFAPGQRRLWMSEVRDIVEGDPLTPFSRVAVACDFASPFANMSSTGLAWINSDVTLYLHRLPATEWIGFESVNHQATDGVAIGECYLYDELGSIGSATVAALTQRRPAR